MDYFSENPELALWVISGLTSIITALGGAILWYVVKNLKEVGEVKNEVGRNTRRINGVHQDFLASVSKIYTSQESHGERINQLQRSLDHRAMEQGNRTDRLMESVQGVKHKLDTQQTIFGKLIKVVGINVSDIKNMKTDVVRLNENMILITSKKGDKNGN